MDFRDSAGEAAFRSAARAWLRDNAELRNADIVEPGIFTDYPDAAQVAESRSWQRKKFDSGWAGINWPKAYGGRGGSIVEQIIWDEEELSFRTPQNLSFIGLSQVGFTILKHGTEDQKDRYLRPILNGEHLWCQLFSEPGSGSDFAALETSATREGDDWRISGRKTWISDGNYADFGFLVARSDVDLPKHRGLTCFLVDMRAPGILVRDIRQMSGTSHYSEVEFDQALLSDSQRIGGVDSGWEVTLTTLMYERLFVGSSAALGRFGGPQVGHLISAALAVSGVETPAQLDSALRQRLAALMIRHRSLQFMSLRLLTTIAQDGIPGAEASIAKLAAAELDQEIVNIGLDILGGPAAAREDLAPLRSAFEAALFQAPLMRVAGGTGEIQRTIVAERLLRLPQDSFTPRGTPFKMLHR